MVPDASIEPWSRQTRFAWVEKLKEQWSQLSITERRKTVELFALYELGAQDCNQNVGFEPFLAGFPRCAFPAGMVLRAARNVGRCGGSLRGDPVLNIHCAANMLYETRCPLATLARSNIELDCALKTTTAHGYHRERLYAVIDGGDKAVIQRTSRNFDRQSILKDMKKIFKK
ncbi:hypothetical protein BC629DRAFT_1446480 [Irpex lacteus]|nr:hypothetical protein BC629DRAFT_1446480 [Irpex lacteus]